MGIYRNWLLYKYSLLVVVGLVSICLYNYALDLYSVLRKDFSGTRQEPNQNFAKAEDLLAYPHRYNSFLFGSSRT